MDGPARRPSASRIPRLHLKAPHSAVTGSQSAKKRHAKNFAAHTRPASCGKTTQVSQFILFDEWESGLLVACTQTRVIAATSAARRVAQELDVDLVPNDGLLLQELRSDRELSRCACVMVDKAHERTKNTDLLLALLKQTMGMRPDLKVVIQYLREATPDYRKAVLETVAHVAQTKPEGSILVFMTSVQEIEETCGLIRKKVPGLQVLPLYPSLSRAQMEGVMDTKTGRKCIVSTNVAEDGLTIDGVTLAIDRERPIADH
ncbi:uncharacterized protein NECHADRAFT_76710 [Fusarium vanettenii 77-13-4]|uniref:Helicase C-terminal domain-containing protein n=1 Tax=Fusarium vanettenii (strain ATCC MYA-4622 / CBS 123669 / FGSC 9596 / NRRL 45880 / 77-13-4) TaxID=660122 RepID=C7Z512_FUSV7|nr:uncharacterized protein NECHADRAFT_76710 [Fusarium vanettenii 77-13-4]EEU40440.1 hypothetical protein NECHADRAFT_76710 [Fusarium vanettenii 77-13-4]